MPKKTAKRNGLSSVRKTFDIVEAIWELDGATLSELTSHLDIPNSTIHIHLQTLRDKGYIIKDDTETYRLSLRFLTFGEHSRTSHPLARTAPDPVENLAEKTGERVICMTEQSGLGTILCVGEGDQSIRTDVSVGTNAYLHCSAGGKAILAFYPEEQVDKIIDKWSLPKLTDNTITDRDTLKEDLADIRDRGIAVAHEEYFEGVITVGAPIQHGDSVYGAVVVLGPAQRLYNDRDKSELHNNLLATANTIEVNLRLDSDNS